ncbi:MAG: indole-3-glycerol phosphate synthase TrpC [Ktedonobacterales bacterium]
MAETFLERIVIATRQRIAIHQAQVGLDLLETRAAKAHPPQDFAEALRPRRLGAGRLIGEVKRASPSKGLLAKSLDPVAQALAYQAGRAAAISVLTEPNFFLGSLEDLEAVRAAVGIPVLCKDFIIDDYQVYEARAAGADAILLISGLLDPDQLEKLFQLAHRLGMESLIETHSAEELASALRLKAPVIGINSRDLKTFAVDNELLRRLGHRVPSSRILVAESGITNRMQATQARAWGADAILVGEALMRAPDATGMARTLATAAGGAPASLFGRPGSPSKPRRPFVKLCGLTLSEHGSLASELGADAIGLIFAPSRRQVGYRQARQVIQAASGTLAVGVFVNRSPATVAAISESLGLGAVQLSGDESPDMCAEVAALTNVPVIRALRLESQTAPEALDAYALAGAALLLDTPSTNGSYGGTGQVGDWRQGRILAERWPIILSGGLTPENVAAALVAVEPTGVDVSSGIETGGSKDREKMRAFLRAARGGGLHLPPPPESLLGDIHEMPTAAEASSQ